MVHSLSIIFWTIWALGILLVLAYGFVLMFGAPYFPSLKKHVDVALDLLDLKPGQTVFDLGCGDARFLKAAAKRGIKGVGYELNPFMFAYSWVTTRRYRKLIKIRMRNFWKVDISKADAIFVFLLDKYMPKLDEMIKQQGKKNVILASHTFKIPGKKITKQNYGIFLYKY
ncbi:class I SAM-dependent methyltransferase [Candidatus Saccharibacteria bacterium]|nr:class I SAM-dependent methyltransferase [Candidatus Saccharibacteria bacterium]